MTRQKISRVALLCFLSLHACSGNKTDSGNKVATGSFTQESSVREAQDLANNCVKLPGQSRPVCYEDRNGLAIVGGDQIMGTIDEIKKYNLSEIQEKSLAIRRVVSGQDLRWPLREPCGTTGSAALVTCVTIPYVISPTGSYPVSVAAYGNKLPALFAGVSTGSDKIVITTTGSSPVSFEVNVNVSQASLNESIAPTFRDAIPIVLDRNNLSPTTINIKMGQTVSLRMVGQTAATYEVSATSFPRTKIKLLSLTNWSADPRNAGRVFSSRVQDAIEYINGLYASEGLRVKLRPMQSTDNSLTTKFVGIKGEPLNGSSDTLLESSAWTSYATNVGLSASTNYVQMVLGEMAGQTAIRHEFGHVFGLFHEHARESRPIEIMRDNIIRMGRCASDGSNCNLLNQWTYDAVASKDFGEFDFSSLMIYASTSHRDLYGDWPDGLVSMRHKNGPRFSSNSVFSKSDILSLNSLYFREVDPPLISSGACNTVECSLTLTCSASGDRVSAKNALGVELLTATNSQNQIATQVIPFGSIFTTCSRNTNAVQQSEKKIFEIKPYEPLAFSPSAGIKTFTTQSVSIDIRGGFDILPTATLALPKVVEIIQPDPSAGQARVNVATDGSKVKFVSPVAGIYRLRVRALSQYGQPIEADTTVDVADELKIDIPDPVQMAPGKTLTLQALGGHDPVAWQAPDNTSFSSSSRTANFTAPNPRRPDFTSARIKASSGVAPLTQQETAFVEITLLPSLILSPGSASSIVDSQTEFRATGGNGTYVYSINASGTSGVSINSQTGIVRVLPTAVAGNYVVKASSGQIGRLDYQEATSQMTVTGPPAVPAPTPVVPPAVPAPGILAVLNLWEIP